MITTSDNLDDMYVNIHSPTAGHSAVDKIIATSSGTV